MHNVLVVIETQRVKHYLFASPYLRETRGASVILDRLNRKEIADCLEKSYANQYEIVYLGGGSGRVLFANQVTAEKFQKEVYALYTKQAPGANVAVAVVSRSADESFAAWFKRGVLDTQKTKLNPTLASPTLAGRWIRPCSSCGVRPAQNMLSEHGEHYLCNACSYKRDEVNKLYQNTKPGETYKRRALKSSSELCKDYPNDFIFATLSASCLKKSQEVFLPQDVDDIAEHSRPANYIGFIYADGNAMGEAIKNLISDAQPDEEAKASYQAFSSLIDQATREAATDAVIEHLWSASDKNAIYNIKEGFLPAEFILAGGDDLMLMVPADKVLDIAITFIEGFQRKTIALQEFDDYKGKLPSRFANGFTTSAGVVIAHAGYPASELMELAAGLMKLAKSKAAQSEGVAEGTLDFAVVHDASTASFKQRRKAEYTQSVEGKKLVLTERPYTASGCETLLKQIRALKSEGVARNKLKALYPAIFHGWVPAQFECRRILARLHSTGDLARSETLQAVVNELSIFPFRAVAADDEWTTYLSELIELYDFVHVEGAPNQQAQGDDHD